MIPLDPASVDPHALARAARRLAEALPAAVRTPVALEATPGWGVPLAEAPGWTGLAADAAGTAVTAALTAYRQARLAVGEAADALAATARALAAARADLAAADRLAAAEGPALAATGAAAPDSALVATLRRLRADAAAQTAAADAGCAARLRALLAARIPVLAPLVAPAGPEQVGLAALAAGGWASIPAELIGPLAAFRRGDDGPGVPVLAREIEARIALADRPDLLTPGADGLPRQYLQAGADGRLTEVWGPLATARTVVILVAGTHTAAHHFVDAQQQGDATYAELRRQAGPAVAVVSWDGSPEPPSVPLAALRSYAERAAPMLRRFAEGLPLAPGARVTLIGHSYGAVVAGEAVRGGLRPAALIGVAPAGFGPAVRSAADLDRVPTYVQERSDDPIKDEWVAQNALEGALADLGALVHLPAAPRLVDPGAVAARAGIGELGRDPRCLAGTVELASGGDGPDWLPVSDDRAVHLSYFRPGSVSLRQLVAVAAGHRPALAPVGTCPRS